jgi:hypothetical protein
LVLGDELVVLADFGVDAVAEGAGAPGWRTTRLGAGDPTWLVWIWPLAEGAGSA